MKPSANILNTDQPKQLVRLASIAKSAPVLTDIYQEEVNVAIWKSQLSGETLKDISNIMKEIAYLNVRIAVDPNCTVDKLIENVSELKNAPDFCSHIEVLVDMFCTLFELKQVGLRLALLNNAMCPKFHVDKIPCRLVTTFSGCTTQWIPHNQVDRSKLGAGSLGMPDEESGIIQSPQSIQHLSIGDVALLKGEGWYNNENGGAVHRSPTPKENEQRLLLTLDFLN